MILYFRAKLEQLGLTYHEFFETAYHWRFGKLVTIDSDYAQFLLHSVLPKYVIEYLKHLQESEDGSRQMLVVQSNGTNQQQHSQGSPPPLGESGHDPWDLLAFGGPQM